LRTEFSLAQKENISRTAESSRRFEAEAKHLSGLLKKLKVEVGVSDLANYIFYYSAKPFLYGNGKKFSNLSVLIMDTFGELNRKYLSAQIFAIGREEIDVFIVPARGEPFSLVSFFPRTGNSSTKTMFRSFLTTTLVGRTANYKIYAAKSRSENIIRTIQSNER